MPCILRGPTVEELPALSELCLRSKAVWGYDNDFIEACRRELTFEPREWGSTSIAVAEKDGNIVGVAQIKVAGSEADLLKLFVEPTTLRSGVGQTLFVWATDHAISKGANRLVIEADPDAVPFSLWPRLRENKESRGATRMIFSGSNSRLNGLAIWAVEATSNE
jgi:hypothetical protein